MDPRPIRIYSEKDVPRLRYIAGIILGDILGLSWELVTDKRKLRKHTVINYSHQKIPGSFRILPDSLLFEEGISPREIIVKDWKGVPVFFQLPGESDIPFDIFAASFFLVSRYEEYLDHETDLHGRFPASSSLAYKNGFLEIPIVDIWVKALARALLQKFTNLAFKRNRYSALLTIDSDQCFSFLGKSIMRSLGGLIKDIKSNSGSFSKRYRTISQIEKDPYDVFEYITENIEKDHQDARFFFPVGEISKYDKNPSWKNNEYRKLINDLAVKYKTGIHPSYNSARDSAMVRMETDRLRTILNTDVNCSRFHYIRFFIPLSYRNIRDAGITEDYSMGYPDEPGFRAGIARPFYFYDILEDKTTELKIFPFQIMDGSLFQYKKLNPEAAKEVILKLICETRKAGGLFISIWHNTSLLDNDKWICWREVFEFMLKNQKNDSLS